MTAKVSKVTVKEGSFKLSELKPGEIQRWGNSFWYFACPRCGMGLRLDHIIEVDKNKKVTISPSVGHPACGLHIFVKKGKIEYLSDMK